MRHLNRNKQTLYYALYVGRTPIYVLDDEGNPIISYEDDSTDPPTIYYEEEGAKDTYEKEIEFKGNIAFTSGGDSSLVDFGVNLADYEAVLVTEKGETPITETTLIWYKNRPTLCEDGSPDPSSADYRVVKVSQSLNEDRFILAKVVK